MVKLSESELFRPIPSKKRAIWSIFYLGQKIMGFTVVGFSQEERIRLFGLHGQHRSCATLVTSEQLKS